MKGLGTGAGNDLLKFKGILDRVPTTPPIDPAANGVRILVNGTGTTGNLLDVTIPPGAYSIGTGQGWRTNQPGTTSVYRNRSGYQGITKVSLRLNRNTPGLVKFVVIGKKGTINGGLAVGPSQLPLTGLLVLDPPLGTSGQCGEALFLAPPPFSPSCSESLTAVECR